MQVKMYQSFMVWLTW